MAAHRYPARDVILTITKLYVMRHAVSRVISHRAAFAIATLSTLLTYCVLGPLSLLPSAEWDCEIGYGAKLVWLIGAVVCLPAAPRVLSFAGVGNGWPHNGTRCGSAAVSSAHANQLPLPRLQNSYIERFRSRV